MSVQSITGVAFKLNTANLEGQYPYTVNINCSKAVIEALMWAVPQVRGGKMTGYAYTYDVGVKPTPDSVHIVRVKEGDNTYWLVVPDNGSEQTFSDACDTCCGNTPVMPAVTIPAVIVEDAPDPVVAPGASTYTFEFPLPDNPNGLNYLANGFTFGGTAITPTPSGSGYASPSALLSFFTTNCAAYGTWTLQNSNKVLQLVSSTVQTAGGSIGLKDAAYCGALPSSATPVDSIKIGSIITPLMTGAITISQANAQDAVNAIKPFLPGATTLAVGGTTPSIQYLGKQVPVQFYYQGNAVAGTAFTAGACV